MIFLKVKIKLLIDSVLTTHLCLDISCRTFTFFVEKVVRS